jgi:hypothetical protein
VLVARDVSHVLDGDFSLRFNLGVLLTKLLHHNVSFVLIHIIGSHSFFRTVMAILVNCLSEVLIMLHWGARLIEDLMLEMVVLLVEAVFLEHFSVRDLFSGQIRLHLLKKPSIVVETCHSLKLHNLISSSRYLMILDQERGSIIAIGVILVNDTLLLKSRFGLKEVL